MCCGIMPIQELEDVPLPMTIQLMNPPSLLKLPVFTDNFFCRKNACVCWIGNEYEWLF